MHSTTGSYSKNLLKLQADYGLAGIGFYWKAVELLMFNTKRIPIHYFQILRYKPLRFFDVYDIIYQSGLFDIDENFCVSLAKDAQNGIEEKSLNNYFDHLLACACPPAHPCAGTQAGTDTGTPECALPGPIKEEIRREYDAQSQFNRFMQRCCNHLREMEEPLTLDQFRELKKGYSWQQIQDVLIQMENEVDLYRKKRSCYQTALVWLKRRYKEAG